MRFCIHDILKRQFHSQNLVLKLNTVYIGGFEMRALSAAVALAAVFSSVGYTQSCDTTPEFAGHRTANGVVRAQYNAVSRGEWSDVIHFG